MPSITKIFTWLKGIWGGGVTTEYSTEIVSVNLLDYSPIQICLMNDVLNVNLMPTPSVELLIYKNELNVNLMRKEPINVVINE